MGRRAEQINGRSNGGGGGGGLKSESKRETKAEIDGKRQPSDGLKDK